ncbi:MAG TPA: protein kinase [Verrucomicrobiae bacterium]|nr:protein kinase [Verrucomicrobiae bacterium]
MSATKQTTVSTTSQCTQCGAALPEGILQGLCPRCLARGAEYILATRRSGRPASSDSLAAWRGEGQGEGKSSSSSRIRYFGDYELLEEIARGGMGVVWKARQVSLNRTVAVKVLLAGKFSSPEFVQRFRTEAEAAANLQHPGIVAIHEVGEHEGQLYFSMDYVDGPNLAQLARDQPLPARRAAALLKTIAEAVHYAHQRSLIHRDLKPSNVLLDSSGRPHVTDFGLAKFVAADARSLTSQEEKVGKRESGKASATCDSLCPGGEGREGGRFSEFQSKTNQSLVTSAATDLTMTGQVLGTPSFMPPEQAGGRRGAVTAVSDVYSLGALIYFLLTGRAPFVADTLEETLRQVHEIEPVSPRLLNPAVPRDLETICLKCLEKEPRKRYATAQALAEELGRYLDGEPIHARPVPPAEKLWRWCRRKPALAASLATVFLLLLAIGLGASAMALRISRAKADLARAQRETTANLWRSYLDQARANRLSGRPGRRFDSLAALAKAAAIRPAPELRDEAIAALALMDVRLTNNWTWRQDVRDIGHIYSPNLDLYVVNGTSGEGRIHRTSDNAEIGRLPSVGHSVSGAGAFSPDGRWLASVGSWGKLHVWDVPARRLAITNLPDVAWAFTPDSRQLLLSGEDRRVSLYDLESGALARLYPTQTVVRTCAAMDPLGRWFAGRAAQRQTVTLFDFATGESIRSFTNRAPVTCLALSPDGQLLAVGGVEGMVEVWNTQTGVQQAKLEGHEGDLVVVGFNRAGTILVTAGWDNTWRMWNAQTWGVSLVLPSTSQQVQFSADDRAASYIFHGGQISLLDVASSACFRQMHPTRKFIQRVNSLDISRDGRLAVAAHDNGFDLWDLAAGRKLAAVPAGSCASALFTPDGASILTSSLDGVGRWPLRRDSRVGHEEIHIGVCQIIAGGIRRFAALSADGRWAAAAYDESDQVVVFAPDDPARSVVLGRHPAASGVAMSSDARWLATGTWQGRSVKVWNIPERLLEHEFPELGTATVEFSPDGRWLATGSRQFQVWDTRSWSEVYHVERPDPDTVWNWMTFSPDSRLLAFVLDNRDIRLLEAATGRVLANLEAPDRPRLARLRFSPDNTKLVALQNNLGLQVWDLGRLRTELSAMNLDWDMPAYPPATANEAGPPVPLEAVTDPAQDRSQKPTR